MKERFFEALVKFGVNYDRETGWLSKPIIFIVYSRRSRWEIERLFLFEDHFLVFEGEKTSRKISFDKIREIKFLQKLKTSRE
ncbi:hypothetical protein [Metabacillus fastidiosus]|uniref:hypothetical protein n=1 Tax=Metabacillus fastidiosus TaxID=1458 RepID=UPI002E1D8E25|nr:hypothetical protein [Metabacillus fastidiosus]